MKSQIKLLGIDDGPFSHGDHDTIIIGTIVRANGYLEGVIKREILVDGLDATTTIIDIIKKTRHRTQLHAVLTDGVTVGGFNVIDMQAVFDETGIPMITVTRDLPDFEGIMHALQSHFSDWKVRYELIRKGALVPVETKHNPLYMKHIGIDERKAKEIITLSTIQGVIPEPIRMAHLIASGIIRGESYGKT